MSDRPIAQARALRGSQPAAAVATLTEAARRHQLDALELEAAGRMLQGLYDKHDSLRPKLRVHLVGQCTTAWLMNVLAAVTAGRGQPAVITEGGFDQVVQDLLALPEGSADVVVLLPWSARVLADERSPADRIADELGTWQQAWAIAKARGLKIVQVGYDVAGTGALGLALGASQGPRRLVRALNDALRDALPAGALFLDLDEVAALHGRAAFYDARRWAWTRQPFSEAGVAALAQATQAAVRALTTGPKKVLVLDCDNTLWGGVVGETGPLGVELGENADGMAFRTFQAWCKAASQRGVVLAVATKNEVDDARGPFVSNTNMILRYEDLAAFEANWGPKPESLKRIAAQLSLGLDSFVFVDDNPAERELMRQALPEVEVPELPADPAGYVAALEAGLYFEAVALTAEDAARSQQYQAERGRREAEASFTNLDDYLTSLRMTGELRTVDEADLPRVVQLLAKTNQFNLTTRRHGSSYVEGLIARPEATAITLRMADRFGDHGLVALALAEPDGDALRIDTLLMSCRVIARTAEEYLFNAVLAHAQKHGFKRLIGDYLPTKKNAQVADLYPRFGFAAAGDVPGEAEGRRFVLDLEGAHPVRTFVQPPEGPTG